MQYTVDELSAICDKHIKWLRGEAGGEKADLRRKAQAEEAHPSLFDDDRLTAVEEGQLSAIADYYDEEASAMTAPFCAPSLGRKRIKYNE